MAYSRAPLWVWTAAIAAVIALYSYIASASPGFITVASVLFVLIAVPLNIPLPRRKLFSDSLLIVFRTLMPAMSDTEREAMEAGTVWWDAELFSGRPRWKKLLALAAPKLSAEEQAFLDGPVEELCWSLLCFRHCARWLKHPQG